MNIMRWVILAALVAASVAFEFIENRAAAGLKGGVKASQVARGKYLVGFGGCNDCHTPLKFTHKGP
jgi:hypothetical protein